MQDTFGIGLIALLFGVFAGRLINERGMRALTAEQKARFLDAFSAQRKYSLLPLIAIIVLSLALPGRIPFWVLMSLFLGYVCAIYFISIRKMHSIALPSSYIRSYTSGQGVQIGGLLFYFAALQGWVL